MISFIRNGDSQGNPTFITPWSLIHFLTGVILMLNANYFNIDKEFSFSILVLVHTLYELKDFYFSYIYKGPKNLISEWANSNSLFNILGDTVFFILGVVTVFNQKLNKQNLIIANVCYVVIFMIFFLNKDLK